MPSASTTTPFAASEATESSLCERTMPGSVLLTISRVCVRSIFLELYVHAVCRLRSRGGACAGGRGHAGAQRTGEFHAVAETVFRILGQRAVEERRKARRHVGVDGKNVDGRLVRDLEHELRHRFALEGQLAAQQLVEAHCKGEQVARALDLLAGELLGRHE